MTYEEAVRIINSYFLDENGLPMQNNGDRGDSASRVGIIAYLRKLVEPSNLALEAQFQNQLEKLEIEPGIYIRNPSAGPFPEESYVTDPSRMSRDNMNPLIIAMGAYEEYDRLADLEKQFMKRYSRYQNADIMGLSDWAMWFRIHKPNWFDLLLMSILDLQLLVQTVIQLIRRKLDPNNTSDDVLTSLLIIQAYHVCPTPTSWLARKIYNLSKPLNALRAYFSPESGAPPIARLYEEAGKGILK